MKITIDFPDSTEAVVLAVQTKHGSNVSLDGVGLNRKDLESGHCDLSELGKSGDR